MPDHPAPNWQPISALPLIAKMIDEALDDGRTQLQNLDDARSRPHVLDDALVNRVIRVYSDQAEFVPVYQEQLERWERLDLTSNQRCEVERLKTQVTSLRNMLLSLLTLARELKASSIDAILSKSDEEVALDVLLGKLRP